MLNGHPAPHELTRKGQQELVTAAGGRRRELVEKREIGTAATRPQPYELCPRSPDDAPAPAPPSGGSTVSDARFPNVHARLRVSHAGILCNSRHTDS